MSFRELTIFDGREVLRRWTAGQSARQMAREGVVSRRTATRYIEAAKALGLKPSNDLTDEAVRDVATRVQGNAPPDQLLLVVTEYLYVGGFEPAEIAELVDDGGQATGRARMKNVRRRLERYKRKRFRRGT